jgi:ligand-binding sensor domain-containing protein
MIVFRHQGTSNPDQSLFFPIFVLMSGLFYKMLLGFCLCGISFQISAQQYSYVQYHSGTAAPFDQVNTVIQDENGFLWIGSQNGLYRFDGIHYDFYSLHTESQSIHQLHKNGDQLLFVNDLGIYQIEELDSKPKVSPLKEGSLDERTELPFYPNDFILDKEQVIWLAQSNHSIGKLQEGDFESYSLSQTEKEQKLAIQEDSRGRIWVLSPLSGLFLFDKATQTFKKKLSIKNGSALLVHKDYLLVGNDAIKVYSIEENDPRLIKAMKVEDDQITALYVDHNDQFFIGTQKGKLFSLADMNAPLQTIYGANEAHRVEKLDFGCINQIYVAAKKNNNHDNLWICSETGLWLLQKRFFETVKDLPMVNPIAIATGNDGKAWVPITYIYEITPSDDEFVAKPIMQDLQGSAVAQDLNGYLWVASSTPNVSILKFKNDKLLRRYDDFKERGEGIFNIYPDSRGNLWFCQAPSNKPITGIAMINTKDEIKYYDEEKGFSSRILAIKESSRGEIYAVGIGESSYLYRFDAEEDRFVNLSLPLPFEANLNFEAHDLTIDDRDVVWLATTDGLLRYDAEKITLIENDILGQEEVRGVAHFANNSLWISTATKGLVFHHKNTSTVLGESEGLPALISAYRCITSDAEGRLWAGTAEGLVYTRIPAATLPHSFRPAIRKFYIDQKEYTEDLREIIKVKPHQELRFIFTNLSFPARNVHYEYRLLAKEDREIMLEEQSWLSIGNKNDLALSQFGLGHFYLEVRASQPGGFQWSKPLNIEINVYKPWYMKNWVHFTAVGLLLLFLAYYFRVYASRRYKRLLKVLKYSKEKLEKKEAQLHQKIQEFEETQEELDSANSNIHTLELFIKAISKKASWNDIITAMGKAVEESPDIDAFEIAFKEKDEIVHKGYSELERSGYTFRSKPFDTKTSLTCWAMANEQEVLINDFDSEHPIYIEKKDAYRFSSLLFIPFTLENDQPVVLCAYSTHKNHFDPNDLVMFRILANFIYFSIREEIRKK